MLKKGHAERGNPLKKCSGYICVNFAFGKRNIFFDVLRPRSSLHEGDPGQALQFFGQPQRLRHGFAPADKTVVVHE